jgi:hypothetical protein
VNQGGEGQVVGKNGKEIKAAKSDFGKGVETSKYESFADVICYNCGMPEHHKSNCKKHMVCFICKKEDHIVESCTVRA